MPIEIKELIIKTSISDEVANNSKQMNMQAKNNESTEAIVAACVEQVLQVLKDREDR